MHKTTAKEDDALSQALEWLNAPREVLTGQETAEDEAAWLDATMDAAGFFALEHVPPVQAAMLLCRFSPHDDTESDAENCTTDCTSPNDFKRLRLTFVSIDQNRPARRSLLDWMAIAAGAGRVVHPWAQRYAKHRGLCSPAEPTPVERPLHEAPTPAPTPVEPAPVLPVKETPAERRARWLALFEEEEKHGKRGALQRLADREGVDRSNMSKQIADARGERNKAKREGPLCGTQLVKNGKRAR
ncbi:MAG: hypothetical protein PHU77_14605 [Simplicispira sp.]|nr:hypothetical protein [Simplicispira sp.]